jgi:hypothetical protein
VLTHALTPKSGHLYGDSQTASFASKRQEKWLTD